MPAPLKKGSWRKRRTSPQVVGSINAGLADALGYCPTLKSKGWEFRCCECHISTGTFRSGFKTDWHYHQEYQLQIALEGSFEFEIRGQTNLRLRTGDALLIPWKRLHRWRCVTTGPMMGISLELLPTPESIQADGELPARPVRLKRPEIMQEAEKLLKEASGSVHLFGGQVLGSRLHLLLAELMEPWISSLAEPVSSSQLTARRGRNIVGWVIRYLDENAASKIRLAKISQRAGLSSRHLHRLFLKHAGKSVHDYLLERRLNRARDLLRQSGKEILVKEIAFTCGFSSTAYFSHAFRSAYGVSPSAFLLENARLRQRSTTVHPEE